MTGTPSFPRQFAAAFGAQDAAGFAALFALDGSFHSLTGLFFEGRAAIEKGMAEEFAGLSRVARLVSGKTAFRSLEGGLILLHQRFVVTGLRSETGADLPRLGALLTAVLHPEEETFRAVVATFAVLEG